MSSFLQKILELEKFRYRDAFISMKRAKQITESNEWDELKKNGKKIAVVAMEQVLNKEIEIINEEEQ